MEQQHNITYKIKMDKSSAAYFWCVFGVILIINLPFIVCDLVFAYQGTLCVLYEQTGVSFDLATWLEVDGYIRVAITSLFFLVAIASCANLDTAVKILVCTWCVLFLNSLFSLAWLIVGAVMFWGNLQPLGVCSGTQVEGYMYAILIIGFIGVCSSMVTSAKQNREGE